MDTLPLQYYSFVTIDRLQKGYLGTNKNGGPPTERRVAARWLESLRRANQLLIYSECHFATAMAMGRWNESQILPPLSALSDRLSRYKHQTLISAYKYGLVYTRIRFILIPRNQIIYTCTVGSVLQITGPGYRSKSWKSIYLYLLRPCLCWRVRWRWLAVWNRMAAWAVTTKS